MQLCDSVDPHLPRGRAELEGVRVPEDDIWRKLINSPIFTQANSKEHRYTPLTRIPPLPHIPHAMVHPQHLRRCRRHARQRRIRRQPVVMRLLRLVEEVAGHDRRVVGLHDDLEPVVVQDLGRELGVVVRFAFVAGEEIQDGVAQEGRGIEVVKGRRGEGMTHRANVANTAEAGGPPAQDYQTSP